MIQTKFTLQDIREYVEFLQSLSPDNEIYTNILDTLEDNVLSQKLIKDISINPAYYISYANLVELDDLHKNQPFYIEVEGTAIEIKF